MKKPQRATHPAGTKATTCNISMTEEQFKFITRRAQKLGISRSMLVQMFIDNAMLYATKHQVTVKKLQADPREETNAEPRT